MSKQQSDTKVSKMIQFEMQSGRNQKGAFLPASFEFTVRPHDIAGGVQQLYKNGREESWMVFLFDTKTVDETTEDQSLELQYSFFDGRVGLEWVLVGPRNIAQESRVTAFIRQKGHTVKRHTMNDVNFLRVEDGDLAGLGASILDTLYGVPPDARLGLIIDGIVLTYGKRTDR